MTIKIHVLHRLNMMPLSSLMGTQTLLTEEEFATLFREVTVVEYPRDVRHMDDALNFAFLETQNLDEAWSEENHRSTSVGDIFLTVASDFGPKRFGVLSVNMVGFSFLGTISRDYANENSHSTSGT